MSIKPVGSIRVDINGAELRLSEELPKGKVSLYHIPETHCIMPLKLTEKMIAAAIPELMREGDEDKYRAIGQLICVWDALVETAMKEQKQ